MATTETKATTKTEANKAAVKKKQRQRQTSKGAVEQGTPVPTMVKTTRMWEHPRKIIMDTARTTDQQRNE